MDLLKILQEFKKIRPSTTFSEISRRSVLATIPPEPISSRRIFARFIAATGSLVLAGALIFIIAGGLSATNLAPQFSSIDPDALHAEAQAIDTQINLLNVNYTEVAASTQPAAATESKVDTGIVISVTSSSATTASSTPTSTISVDEILQGLSN
jgi:hypothetical protein